MDAERVGANKDRRARRKGKGISITPHMVTSKFLAIVVPMVVTMLVAATKLRYIGPGYYKDRQPSRPSKPTQPSILSGTENQYQPKCDDALCLATIGRQNCMISR